MTASAIYAFLHSPASYEVGDSAALLLHARRLEPIGRFFRRLGAAICAVMVSETAAGVSSLAGQDPSPLARAVVDASSTVASIFALTEFILTVLFVNNNISSKYSLPRLDDRFNGSKTAAILSFVTVMLLIVGSMSVMVAAVRAAMASSKTGELKVVSTLTRVL